MPLGVMPQIFDNIDKHLLPTLSEAMGVAQRGDFCVGYFNLRGWRQVDQQVEKWAGGDGHSCRLSVGMQRLPEDQLRASMRVGGPDEEIDNATAIKWKRQLSKGEQADHRRDRRGPWETLRFLR